MVVVRYSVLGVFVVECSVLELNLVVAVSVDVVEIVVALPTVVVVVGPLVVEGASTKFSIIFQNVHLCCYVSDMA